MALNWSEFLKWDAGIHGQPTRSGFLKGNVESTDRLTRVFFEGHRDQRTAESV